MAEIVNLRRVRKGKAKAEKEKTAAANRAAFGVPKALRELEQSRTQKADRDLVAHKLEPDK